MTLECSSISKGLIEEAAQAARDRQSLLAFGAAPATKARLLLCGHQYAGKTTLAASLCSEDPGGLPRRTHRTRTSVEQPVPQDAENRTAGVDVRTVTLDGGGLFTLYDLAGQSQYITPHSLIARGSAAVLVLVLSLGDSKDDRKAQLEYWLRFLKARFVPVSEEQLPIVHVVLTHRDLEGHDESDVSYLADLDEWVSPWGEGVVGYYSEVFEGCLTIDSHVYVVDGLEPKDKEMELLRESLRSSRETMLALTEDVPTLVEKIKAELEPMRAACKAWPVQAEDDFWMQLLQQNADLPDPRQESNKDSIMHAAMRFLQAEGEVVWIQHAKLVVLSPQFLCSHVIGKLFAPKWFPVCVKEVMAGRVTRKAIAAAFPRRDVDQILSMVQELDLGFAVDDETFLIPSLLENEGPAACAWRPSQESVVLGRRLLCEAATDYFGPSFFPRLQVCLRHIFGASLTLWRDGADGAKAGVCCRVTPSFNGQGVDVWAHGRANGATAVLTVVSEVVEHIHQVMLHDCVNIQPTVLALSPTELRSSSSLAPDDIPGYLVSVLESTIDELVPPSHPPSSAPLEPVLQLLGRPQRHAFSDLWPCKTLNITDSKLRVLLIRSNSRLYDAALDTDREEKCVRRALRQSQHADSIEFLTIGDVQPEDIAEALSSFRPHCVHFVGHHEPGRGFEYTRDEAYYWLSGQRFREMVEEVAPPLPLACVVVNCCDTREFAEAIQEATTSVVCTANIDLVDMYGLLFAEMFWRELMSGNDVQAAFNQACAALKSQMEQDQIHTPVVPDPQYTLLLRKGES